MELNSTELFPKAYNETFLSILNHEFERYTFSGGRASAKSSFISLVIIILMINHPDFNALVVRKYQNTLRRSVFEQLVWAIHALHAERYFTIPKGTVQALPIRLHRREADQVIIFSGADDPEKLKSLKASSGYFAILWAEEKTEFSSYELQNIEISALRGGNSLETPFFIFESYNPPSARLHWCNEEVLINDPHRKVVKTTYKDVPATWLGSAILHDIERTKLTNRRAYENIYLGIPTGSGQNVFENVVNEKVSREKIDTFDILYCGIDWGYYPDPFHFVMCGYEKETLYIFRELRLYKYNNIDSFNRLKEYLERECWDFRGLLFICDSSEPKSIADYRSFGADARGAVKGTGSRDMGFKWLVGLRRIVIDAGECPETYREFSIYEHEIDKRTGEVLEGFPAGQPDHAIDAVRYALERVFRHAGA